MQTVLSGSLVRMKTWYIPIVLSYIGTAYLPTYAYHAIKLIQTLKQFSIFYPIDFFIKIYILYFTNSLWLIAKMKKTLSWGRT